jgi:hypothetical protein
LVTVENPAVAWTLYAENPAVMVLINGMAGLDNTGGKVDEGLR